MIKQLFNNFFSSSKQQHKYGTVVSFPKCGRTWLRVMMDDLDVPMEYTHAGSSHAEGVHFNKLTAQQLNPTLGPIIFLMRDPRDVVVSGYFQVTKRLKKNYRGSLSDFVKSEYHGIKKIITFYNAWLEKEDDNILIVTYEELQRNPVNVLQNITTFLDLSQKNKLAYKHVAEKYAFEKMHKMELSGAFKKKYGGILTPKNSNDPESFKTRKGKVGGYTAYLSADDIAYCEEVIRQSPKILTWYNA